MVELVREQLGKALEKPPCNAVHDLPDGTGFLAWREHSEQMLTVDVWPEPGRAFLKIRKRFPGQYCACCIIPCASPGDISLPVPGKLSRKKCIIMKPGGQYKSIDV